MSKQQMFKSRQLSAHVCGRFARSFYCSSRLGNGSKDSFSFYPTASFLDQESHEQRMKEQEAAVPTRPSFQSIRHIYKDITRPQDVCDLLWVPSFEDALVISLSKECHLMGDSLYQIVSKSPVTDANLMFTNIAIDWMDAFKAQNLELTELGETDDSLMYSKSSLEVPRLHTTDYFSSFKNLEAFCNLLLENGQSIESIARFLLTNHQTLTQYNYILRYLDENLHELNPLSISDFAGYMIDNAFKRQTAKEVSSIDYDKSFDVFLRERILPEYPDTLRNMSASMLDKLAFFSSVCQSIPTAAVALTELVHHHKTAPSKHTWNKFLAAYIVRSDSQNSSKEQVLRELSDMKPIFFYHELTSDAFCLLLSKVVDNVHDLSHLVRLAFSSSPHVLAECGFQTIEKLEKILSTSTESHILKAVQVAQLVRLLELAGYKKKSD